MTLSMEFLIRHHIRVYEINPHVVRLKKMYSSLYLRSCICEHLHQNNVRGIFAVHIRVICVNM